MSPTLLHSEAGDEVVEHTVPPVSDAQSEVQQPSPTTPDERPIPSASFYAPQSETEPRRGGRVRKPTQKSSDAVDIALAAENRDSSVEQKDEHSGKGVKSAKNGPKEVELKKEDDSDKEVYCICRGEDDGSFMVSCERCEEW